MWVDVVLHRSPSGVWVNHPVQLVDQGLDGDGEGIGNLEEDAGILINGIPDVILGEGLGVFHSGFPGTLVQAKHRDAHEPLDGVDGIF